jgi:DNA-binding response OmpR family regulator
VHVLIVEDDVTLAREVARALTEYGISVDAVETGRAAPAATSKYRTVSPVRLPVWKALRSG